MPNELERRLGLLQKAACTRKFATASPAAGTQAIRLPNGEQFRAGFSDREKALVETAITAMWLDERTEHVKKPKDAILAFVGEVRLSPKVDHIGDFIAKWGHAPQDLTCYVPIESLKVTAACDLLGVLLLPIDDPSIPKESGPWQFSDGSGSVAAVPVRGSDPEKMANRAQARVERAMRVFRIGVMAHGDVLMEQARFRLGETYAVGDEAGGWRVRPDAAYELELDDALVALVQAQPMRVLAEGPTTPLQGNADRTLQWMERAWFEPDPLVKLLFLFFGMEALLGDEAEGLKAPALAFREAMLSHLTTGGFTDPGETYKWYDTVRSVAVHGGELVEVDPGDANRFARRLRDTANRALDVSRQNELSSRKALRRFLDEHTDAADLASWLRDYGGSVWTKWLDKNFPIPEDADASGVLTGEAVAVHPDAM